MSPYKGVTLTDTGPWHLSWNIRLGGWSLYTLTNHPTLTFATSTMAVTVSSQSASALAPGGGGYWKHKFDAMESHFQESGSFQRMQK